MTGREVRGHALMLLATLGGIAGMGIMFSGAMHADPLGVVRGVPFFLIGLWWAGRELGRSMAASRHAREEDE